MTQNRNIDGTYRTMTQNRNIDGTYRTMTQNRNIDGTYRKMTQNRNIDGTYRTLTSITDARAYLQQETATCITLYIPLLTSSAAG